MQKMLVLNASLYGQSSSVLPSVPGSGATTLLVVSGQVTIKGPKPTGRKAFTSAKAYTWNTETNKWECLKLCDRYLFIDSLCDKNDGSYKAYEAVKGTYQLNDNSGSVDAWLFLRVRPTVSLLQNIDDDGVVTVFQRSDEGCKCNDWEILGRYRLCEDPGHCPGETPSGP